MDNNEQWLIDTEQADAWTEDTIAFGEEVVAVIPALVIQTAAGITLQYATTPDGTDLLYEVNFLSITSWAEVEERLTQTVQDVGSPPPRAANAIYNCDTCQGDICHGEVVLLAKLGEINRSPCAPNGEPAGSTFVEHGQKRRVLCLGCQSLLHTHVVSFWDAPLKQHEECEEGSEHRCWREGCSANINSCIRNCRH